MLKSKQKAYNFKLLDQNERLIKLSDYLGKWVLIYFYPKDNTSGCTKEACSFRESFPDFRKLDCEVFGVSTDSISSHKKFAEKYNLPFSLLSDASKVVVKRYGVIAKKKFMGKEYEGVLRTSFLIDPDGRIAKIYENVNPQNHAEEVLIDLKSIFINKK